MKLKRLWLVILSVVCLTTIITISPLRARIYNPSDTSSAGDVTGPGSSTDNAVTRFDETTGKLLQDSSVIIDDSGNITGVNDLTIDGDFATPYQQTITVAKSGGDFTTIQGAVDSITDATINKRYAIKIYPGEYVENIVMEDYVDLVGVAVDTVRITPTSGTAITFSATDSNFYDLTVDTNYGTLTENTSAIIATAGSHILRGVVIDTEKSGGDYTLRAINILGGTIVAFNTFIYYDITGTTTATANIQEAVTVSGTNTIFRGNSILVIGTCDDTNDIFAGFGTLSGTGINFIIANSFLDITTTGGGVIAGLYTLASDSQINIKTSEWFVKSNNGGDAYGGFVSSISTPTTAITTHNYIKVTTNTGNAYNGSIATGDTWNSYFDIIEAADGMTGSGTVNIVASDGVGDLNISGTLSDGTSSLTGGSLTSVKLGSLTSNGFVKTSGSDGTLSVDTSTYLTSSTGASTALDNLASVAINTSLLSDTADTDSLGSTTKEWLNGYFGDAGKLYFGLGQDASINRSAANTMTLTASSGVITSANLTCSADLVINESAGFDAINTVTYNSGTTTADWGTGNVATMTFGAGNITTFAFTDPSSVGQTVKLKLIQDGTGSRTVTAWDADIQWSGGGTAPTLSTGANAEDWVVCIFTNTGAGNRYDCSASLDFQ